MNSARRAGNWSPSHRSACPSAAMSRPRSADMAMEKPREISTRLRRTSKRRCDDPVGNKTERARGGYGAAGVRRSRSTNPPVLRNASSSRYATKSKTRPKAQFYMDEDGVCYKVRAANTDAVKATSIGGPCIGPGWSNGKITVEAIEGEYFILKKLKYERIYYFRDNEIFRKL